MRRYWNGAHCPVWRCFPYKLDAEANRQAWSATLRLAERYGLTVCDAAYLEIASRRRIALATQDQQLRSAAATDGVELLGS